MWRGILFFIKLAVLVAVAVWLANNPGRVAFDWLGYRIDTSVALLILGLAIIIVVAVLLYRIFRALAATPAKVSDGMKGRRERRGQQALTQGLVAVQLGDAEKARLHARRASELLPPQPVLQLLRAQAAQLSGHATSLRVDDATTPIVSASSRFCTVARIWRPKEVYFSTALRPASEPRASTIVKAWRWGQS